MSGDWTIDTVILYDCARLDTNASHFLWEILYKKKNVVFDKDDYIKNQYTKCIKETQIAPQSYPANAVIKKWFIEVVNKLAVKNIGYLQAKHKAALIELAFHDDDLPFVAACHCSNDKRLVSQDSDYKTDVNDYLKSKMSITVLSIEGAINVLEED